MLRVPAFAVISGAAAGAFYVRQLLRAVGAGALRTERIVVVDRDPGCAAAALAGPGVELAVAEWSAWLDVRLEGLGGGAHLVPYHWAPHLLLEWLSRQAAKAGLPAERCGGLPAFGLPFERGTRDGDHALSYATWPCPPACIEPALCPHTRGQKSWSLARDLERAPRGFAGSIVFRSLHLVYGVATIPVSALLEARDRLLRGGGRRRYLVATASHCHGLASGLALGPAG